LQTICRWVDDETGSAVTRHACSDRPKSVLLQLMNILNTLLILSGQLRTLITETFKLLTKSCAMFDSLFVNIQSATACSVEKVNFKV